MATIKCRNCGQPIYNGYTNTDNWFHKATYMRKCFYDEYDHNIAEPELIRIEHVKGFMPWKISLPDILIDRYGLQPVRYMETWNEAIDYANMLLEMHRISDKYPIARPYL